MRRWSKLCSFSSNGSQQMAREIKENGFPMRLSRVGSSSYFGSHWWGDKVYNKGLVRRKLNWVQRDCFMIILWDCFRNNDVLLTFLLSSLVSGRRTTFPRTSGFVDSVVDVDRVNSSFKLSFESSWRSFKATLLTTAFVACDSAKEMFDKTAIRPVINLLLSNCRCGLWKES